MDSIYVRERGDFAIVQPPRQTVPFAQNGEGQDGQSEIGSLAPHLMDSITGPTTHKAITFGFLAEEQVTDRLDDGS